MSAKRAKSAKTGATAKSGAAHTHAYQPFASDPRYERCLTCPASRRADAVTPQGATDPNPGVQRWGYGPPGAQCKTCAYLTRQARGGVWYKCGQRDDLTHGAKTDQRVRWSACARYDAAPPALRLETHEKKGPRA